MDRKTILIWFRNDLRICDNEMLSLAHERANSIVPVFIYDPRLYVETTYGTKKTGVIRAKFINESVQDLQRSIRSLHGELIIEQGLPEEILPELAKHYQIDEVYHHREVAYEETHISSLVEEALWKLKLNLRHFIGHTLYHKEDLPFPIKDIPDEFNVFKKKTGRESSIRPCINTPNELNFLAGIAESIIPSLEDLGFNEKEIELASNSYILGGETEAKKQLDLLIKGNVKEVSESGLSPWLALGCLSVHTFYHALANHSNYPKNIFNRFMDELWWHDYYRFMFKKHGNKFFKSQGFSEVKPLFVDNTEQFGNWKSGRTENIHVNHIMETLNNTGYINQRMRIEAASFLVNDLGINWLMGAAYFEERMIDYSPATNYGSWAHIAGVGSSYKHNLRNIS